MESAYDGRQIVGMDRHRRRSVLVGRPRTAAGWNGEDHQQPARAARAARPGRDVTQGGPAGHVRVVLGGGHAAAAGAEVHLAHPLGVKAFAYRRVKNDELDARDLADLLRMGRLPEA